MLILYLSSPENDIRETESRILLLLIFVTKLNQSFRKRKENNGSIVHDSKNKFEGQSV